MAMENRALVTDPVTQSYWEALTRGELTVQRCKACGHRQHYPRPFCLACLSRDVDLEPVTGPATLYAFTINHAHSNPDFKAELPFVMALVEVADGIRIMARLIDVEPSPEAVHIGMALEFCPPSEARPWSGPAFRPASNP